MYIKCFVKRCYFRYTSKKKKNYSKAENFVLLQPTSPQGTFKDIERAIRRVKKIKKKKPYFC